MRRSDTLGLLSLAFVLLAAAVTVRAGASPPAQSKNAKAGDAAKADPGMTSTMSGVYSSAQATRGEETYFNICVACHPVATYTGPAFQASWANRPLLDLYQVIKTTMPKNDPGTLSSTEVIQMIAYILKLNEVPDGKSDLPATAAALKKIRIETPSMRKGNK